MRMSSMRKCFSFTCLMVGFPGGSVVKNLSASAEGVDLTPGSGRSPGDVNSNPLQYSFLENPMGRGDW